MLYDPRWEAPAETKPKEAWRRALLDAAKLIEERGHCKGEFESIDGRLCAVGAIRVVLYGHTLNWDDRCFRPLGALQGQVGMSAIPDWNDHPNRTKAEVVGALRAAANAEST